MLIRYPNVGVVAAASSQQPAARMANIRMESDAIEICLRRTGFVEKTTHMSVVVCEKNLHMSIWRERCTIKKFDYAHVAW